jgi:hypothetical protein
MAPCVLTVAELAEVLRLADDSNVTHAGGNSTVAHVRSGAFDYAVKDYSGRVDALYRQQQETAALILVNQHLNRYFASPMGVSHDGLRAVHSWIDGIHPVTNVQTVSHMLEMLLALHQLSSNTGQDRAKPAIDHILLPQQLQKQMEDRISVLLLGPPEVRRVTHERLIPAFQGLRSPSNGSGSPTQTLSPSDFGVHNLLWNNATQSMHCVDLEFFGWDDAHKLVCDTLLHPLAQWTQDTAEEFLDGTASLYRLDMHRLAWLWPRLCLKWAAINLARASRESSIGNSAASEQATQRAVHFISQGELVAPDRVDMVERVIAHKGKEHA